MTKEERAVKWFLDIPNSGNISLDKKIKLCDCVSKMMFLAFIGSLIVESILAYILTNGQLFNFLAALINDISQNQKITFTAIFGIILIIPLMVIPFALMLLIKKRLLNKIVSNNNK